MLGTSMLKRAHQIWLRKTAAMLAVLACLLIGTFGGEVLALCVGEGHVAVELSADKPDSTAPQAHGVSSWDGKPCVDATLHAPGRQERLSATPLQAEGKALPLAATMASAPTPTLSCDSGTAPTPVRFNPALKHHRTVVLLN
jgi:hypothetical protein